jgi:hypothetical protein
MSDDAYGATVAKRRLSRRLAELRGTTGYTANHVCDILNWGRGKVGRFEANQWKRPEMSDIRDLIRIYEVQGAERDEIEDLAVRCRVRPWWREFGEIFDNEFPGYENDAATIQVYMPLVVPGLLQTQAYMEAQFKACARSPAWRRKGVKARLRRQEILDRADGPVSFGSPVSSGSPASFGSTVPRLSVVITEASLRYRWGMHSDRREQIDHLAEMSRRRNIDLRIQRFDDGPPTGLSMVNIFGFPDDEPPIVFVETDYSVDEVSAGEAVHGYIQSFERACDAALEPEDTTVYLETLAKRME